MFGYFLRRVDSRFQLARNLGVLPESPEDAVARLERLISMVGGWVGGGREEGDDVCACVGPGCGGAVGRGWVGMGRAAARGGTPLAQLALRHPPHPPNTPRPTSTQVDSDPSADPDTASPLPADESGPASTSYAAGSGEQQAGLVRRGKSALRQYVESFDQATLVQTAR